MRRLVRELHARARDLAPLDVGEYDAFDRKLNGTRAASPVFARSLYDAAGLAKLGLTFEDWTADKAEWSAAASSLPSQDAFAALARAADRDGMRVEAASLPTPDPLEWRRLRDGAPAETELRVGHYLHLTLCFPGSDDLRPVRLIAAEWSETEGDWQVFNIARGSRLDSRRPVRLTAGAEGPMAKVPVGLQVVGPRDTFDLFLIAHREEFDHRALSILDNASRSSIIPTPSMNRLVGYLLAGPRPPEVARTSYTVL